MSTNDPQAQPALRPGLADKLVLTYNNAVKTDGVGAQLQRIYGTYAIARMLGTAYLHSPLTQVDYQGLSALERNTTDAGFHDDFNELLHIASDALPADELFTISLPDISIALLNQLGGMVERRETGFRPVLVRLAVPYGIADRFPDCYEACKEISPFEAPLRPGRALRVALHVRRGELAFIDTERTLPNAYYIEVARRVLSVLDELELDYQIELWTEAAMRRFTVRPDDRGISHRITDPVVVEPEAGELDDFSVFPNLVHRINGQAIDCLRHLATADILVMSRSSFSYVGGILNRNGVVLYHPFWHRAPSRWITVRPDGHVDPLQLRERLERNDTVRGRGQAG